MSSRKAGGRGSYDTTGRNDTTSKGKGFDNSGSGNNTVNGEQLDHDMEDLQIDQSKEGEWEVCTRKPRNRGISNPGRSQGALHNVPKAWENPEKPNTVGKGGGHTSRTSLPQPSNPRKQVGRGTSFPVASKSWESAYLGPLVQSSAPLPLQHGWQWNARSGTSSQPKALEQFSEGGSGAGNNSKSDTVDQQHEGSYEEDDLIEDSDEDFSDDYDSDASQKSHETRKKSSWFKAFFQALDKLSVDQINEITRQWHCPACKNGPGAIDWFKGLQPLITHAKTKKTGRAKLHRDLSNLLEEELARRGASIRPSNELYGKWKGLHDTTNHEIVWPPMVVVMNTLLDQGDNDMWVGMGNQELLEYFKDYDAHKARHSYSPNGHRGMSILIFEASAVGYLEAERLHKHFAEQGTDREAWERRRTLFYPGGRRQLYGFMARKEDMDVFNKHSQGKQRLKFELKSYQEKVVDDMRQMSEDNQQLILYRKRVAEKELEKKTLEESLGVVSQKLHEKIEEGQILRERSYEQYQENKWEMDHQEKFFKEQIAKLHKATEEKEKHFERLLQEERAKARHSDVVYGTKEERRVRLEEIAKFIDGQDKGVGKFEAAREELMRMHEGEKAELRRRYLEDEVELEKKFDTELTRLMEKFAPSTFEASTSSSKKILD